ncbi:hypothetical protein BaRGS_00013955 [Batillaria attramentaria]|uniref:Sulfotransferase domain-containing protein n=1 Tax=Batillaria attramentaria TaxID=370345 RepID=A0ABD0L5U7_9CAEN
MRSRQGCPVRYLQMDGVLYPPLPGYAAHLKQVQNFPCRSDDVWIFGYPKSGNHWMWEMVNMVLKHRSEFENDFMERYLVDFEDLSSPALSRDSRRVLVSHLPCQHAPLGVFEKGVKIIYVMRNPKDVAVSAYNHLASVTDDFRNLSFSDFLSLYMDGKVYYGDWYDHVFSWFARCRGSRNILVVKYEDMKRDLLTEVKRVAKFLDQPMDGDTADRIARACSFSCMKQGKREYSGKWRQDGLIHSVYRKGQVGDWVNWFSPEDNEQFDKRHEERMQQSGGVTVDFQLD